MFTSTLSVGEFAVLTELNAVPLTQVMGVSVQQIGWQYLPSAAQWGGDELFCTLDRIEHAWDQARRQALDRMIEEAKTAGADAVVGVEVTRGAHDLGPRTVEFLVTGTAVRWSTGTPPAWPILTDLSAQEFWLLNSAGWAPAAFVAATAVHFVSQGFGTRWQRRTSFASNQELTEFSTAFSDARRAAVRQLRSQADSAQGNGIVGVTLNHSIEEGSFSVYQSGATAQRSTGLSPTTLAMGASPPRRSDERSGLVITIQAMGTAIRRARQTDRYQPERTLAVTR